MKAVKLATSQRCFEFQRERERERGKERGRGQEKDKLTHIIRIVKALMIYDQQCSSHIV